MTSLSPCWRAKIRSIFMQNCFIVSALQHGGRENPLYMGDILPIGEGGRLNSG